MNINALVKVEQAIMKHGNFAEFLKRLSASVGENLSKQNWKQRIKALVSSKAGVSAAVLTAAAGAGAVVEDTFDLIVGDNPDAAASLSEVKARLVEMADRFAGDGQVDTVRGVDEDDLMKANSLVMESDMVVNEIIGMVGTLQGAFDFVVAMANVEPSDFVAYARRHKLRLKLND